MNILVTGGAGFIGSHVVDAYLKRGHKVSVIDNFSSGRRENCNRKARFFKVDVRDAAAVRKVMNEEKPRIVSHHAAISEVIKSLEDPQATYDVNVMGTANVLAGAEGCGAAKIIFASTGGAIYGDVSKPRVSEIVQPNPLSPYGLSKLIGEEMIKKHALWSNFEYLILRYANVYGPRQNPKGEAGVITIFAGMMRKNKRPVIFGDGKKTRDYVYVDDVVRANVLGLKKSAAGILNIGTGRETLDSEVFAAVSGAMRFKKQPIYRGFRKGEVYRISLNPRRAKKILGWKPVIHFEGGVQKYISYEYGT